MQLALDKLRASPTMALDKHRSTITMAMPLNPYSSQSDATLPKLNHNSRIITLTPWMAMMMPGGGSHAAQWWLYVW